MPIGTPFHSRTSALCASQNWRDWSGYFVAGSYDVVHDYEYHAIRNTAALIDVSPLFKYDVRGEHAARLVNRVITRDALKCAVGQALYTCLCNGAGKVIQDGTVFRIAEDHFRFHLADPALRWLKLNATGLNVAIDDVSEQIAALALQGPNAYEILKQVVDVDLAQLKFFRFRSAGLGGTAVIVSRTGYTGDLGYEIWMPAAAGERAWDLLVAQGKKYGIKPTGILALDVARLEAGFILLEVDYTGAEKAITPRQRYSPYEISLGWTVDSGKAHFVGCEPLREEKERGPSRRIVGLEIDWRHYESLYQQAGLPPYVPSAAWRNVVPVYADGLQVGHATTGAWSPSLKKYIALATIDREQAGLGTALELETMVDYKRTKTRARVIKVPFFDPARKRATF